MKVITAVETYERQPNDVFCFLAGGITNCAEWQDEVIKELESMDGLDNLVIFNPRRKNFPINDPNASDEQITWEFNFLEQMDIFSIYFAKTEKSDQPICFYELGRNLVRMQEKSFDAINRIIVSCEEGFKRTQDVVIQSTLAFSNQLKGRSSRDRAYDTVKNNFVKLSCSPKEHAARIAECYKHVSTFGESDNSAFNAF